MLAYCFFFFSGYFTISVLFLLSAGADRASKCTNLQWACATSDQCIDQTLRCDGRPDCKDGSDETAYFCSAETFRPCKLPQFPHGSYTFPSCGSNCTSQAGSTVGRGTSIVYKCDAGYSLRGAESQTCLNGNWLPKAEVKCSNECKPLVSRKLDIACYNAESQLLRYSCNKNLPNNSVAYFRCRQDIRKDIESQEYSKLTCINGEWDKPLTDQFCRAEGCDPLVSKTLQIACVSANLYVLSCNETLPDNSVAHFHCRDFYQAVESLGYSKLTCINGMWDRPLPDRFCRPVCGKADGRFAESQRRRRTIHGTPVRLGNFPWHVGIYKNVNLTSEWKHYCGGSLISSNTVISAAHCFKHNQPGERNLYLEDTKTMRIGLGKRYITLHDPRDAFAQDYGINKVVILPEWTGSYDNYQYDISIVILDGQAIFTSAVQPICLDFARSNGEEDQPVAGAIGLVPGWGLTEKKEVSDELLVAEMPYVDRETCEKETTLLKYLKKDKICGGNKTTKQTVCNGDNGGGYVFKDSKTNTFFLRGIVSVGTPNCKGSDYALFTKVSKYVEFIIQNYN